MKKVIVTIILVFGCCFPLFSQKPASVEIAIIQAGWPGSVEWNPFNPPRARHIGTTVTGDTAAVLFANGTEQTVYWAGAFGGNISDWLAYLGFTQPKAGRTALDMDKNGISYIAYRDISNNGLYFQFEEGGYFTVAWSTPKLLNDTSATSPCKQFTWPDINVSEDGKTILIVGTCYSSVPYSIWAAMSNDGGKTFTPMTKLMDHNDPSIKPISGDPAIDNSTLSAALGYNGTAYVLQDFRYRMTPVEQRLSAICKTEDYGKTWSAPYWPTPPDTNEWNAVQGWWNSGAAVVDKDNNLHFTIQMQNKFTQDRIVYYFKNGQARQPISFLKNILTGSFGQCDRAYGSMGIDEKGRLYCFYLDVNLSAQPPNWTSRNIFVNVSEDLGETWHGPVRLTDENDELIVGSTEELQPCCLQVPRRIGKRVVIALTDGLWYDPLFPQNILCLSVMGDDILATEPDKDPNQPDPMGYIYQKSSELDGPTFHWYDITTKGTKITQWYNGDQTVNAAGDDGSAGPFPIGFPFTFYDQSFDSFYVGANGLMSFSQEALNTAISKGDSARYIVGYYDGNYTFPMVANFKNTIAPFYNDLTVNPDTLGNGAVYFWTNQAKDTCIVSWADVGSWGGDNDAISFQIVLDKKLNGITVQWLENGLYGYDKTSKVGVQKENKIGVFYSSNGQPPENAVREGTAVRFKYYLSAVDNNDPLKANRFDLAQNYPNPFNPTTTIQYDIARASHVTITIFDISGREVVKLIDTKKEAGSHKVMWDASEAGSGIYFYHIQTADFKQTKKMILIK